MNHPITISAAVGLADKPQSGCVLFIFGR